MTLQIKDQAPCGNAKAIDTAQGQTSPTPCSIAHLFTRFERRERPRGLARAAGSAACATDGSKATHLGAPLILGVSLAGRLQLRKEGDR
jgi:hypothetical protein